MITDSNGTSTDELTASLRSTLVDALEKIQAMHREAEKTIEAIESRERQVAAALEGLESFPEPAPRTTLSISEERLEKIQKYIEKVGHKRQVDISNETKENSGTVSVALRVLAERGVIQRGDVDRGSRIWYVVDQKNGSREQVVRPGEGVSEGRLVA